jgi:hypothetical protein
MDSVDFPKRTGYGLYRIQTDIMMHRLLSGKNLLMVVDGTYPGEDALGVPEKWEMRPFSHNWCSSLFMSLDPVAIESVCHDFLRTEYNGPSYAESRPNWDGVDDYLHQAADSSLWPAGILYDPDNDGKLVASLGVHEHWNDPVHMQYTRNLGSGNGIELYKVHEVHSGLAANGLPAVITVFPNPTNGICYIKMDNPINQPANIHVFNQSGIEIISFSTPLQHSVPISLTDQPPGIYLISIELNNRLFTTKLVLR